MSDPIRSAVNAALDAVVSAEDMQAGFKDVKVLTMAGQEHTVRVGRLAANLGLKILRKYASSEDPRDLIRPFLAKEFATDAFLDRLTPGSLAQLSNVVVGLAVGPETLRKMLSSRMPHL